MRQCGAAARNIALPRELGDGAISRRTPHDCNLKTLLPPPPPRAASNPFRSRAKLDEQRAGVVVVLHSVSVKDLEKGLEARICEALSFGNPAGMGTRLAVHAALAAVRTARVLGHEVRGEVNVREEARRVEDKAGALERAV